MDANKILQQCTHRQWPLPRGAWVMRQSWQNLLFAHWPLPPQILRPLIPPVFTLDTFEQEAWLGIVPFQMYDVAPHGVPALPWLSESPELNVRTYVTVNGVPGVYFFSLDAANIIFVALARAFFSLPYFHARMSVTRRGDTIYYNSQRTHTAALAADYIVSYRSTSPVDYATPSSLPFWLTERYCLYTFNRRDQLYRVDIHHGPWPLQGAELEIRQDSMARSHNIILPDTPPLLHYAQRQDTLIWLPRRVMLA